MSVARSCVRRIVGCFTLVAATRAGAQAPADSTARRPLPDDSARVATLRPVIVTVLQTPFDVARAPYAVTALGVREIQGARPGFNLAEAMVGVPGVQVDNRFNYALGERISVRGFGARAQFGVRGVRVLVDGIPATLPDGQSTLNHVDVAALGHAEVVRGPASAIYGNASGGVLQLESEPAPDAAWEERLRVSAGSDGLSRLQSTTAGRLGTDRWPVAYRANVSRLRYGGYRDFSDAENLYLSTGVAIEGERTRVALAMHAADYDAKNPGSLSDVLLAQDRDQAFARNVAQRTGEEGRHAELGLTVRQSVGAGELRASAWGIGRELDNPIPNVIIDLHRRAGGARVAYASQLGLAGRPVQWVLGGELQAQRDERLNYVNEGGVRGADTLDQREHVRTAAAFAQVSGSVTRRLTVLAATRVDQARFAVTDLRINPGDPDDSGDRTMLAVSPSLGASYEAGPSATLYANVATAFETPTTTELANRPTGAGGFNPDLEPQRTTSVEAGTTLHLGRRAVAQLAAYRALVRDALIAFEVEGAPGRVFYRNAGSAVHRGIEAGLTVIPRSDVSLRAAYTLTDARFRRFVVNDTAYDENRVPGVAPNRVDAVLSYSPSAGPLRGLLVDVEERYVSAVPVNNRNVAGSASAPYALLNLRVGLEALRVGAAALSPFAGVTNALDREYNTAVSVNAFGGRYYEPGPGRAFYVGLGLSAGAR
jgi:iron complex outermembrane recepter protein